MAVPNLPVMTTIMEKGTQGGAPAPEIDEKYEAGSPSPQGATYDGERGTNFALFSEGSESVELCLFNDSSDAKESLRIPLRERTNGVWHIFCLT